MHEDPITLHIALDKEQKAEGTLYIDDGQSFEYKEVEKRGNNDNKPVFIFYLSTSFVMLSSDCWVQKSVDLNASFPFCWKHSSGPDSWTLDILKSYIRKTKLFVLATNEKSKNLTHQPFWSISDYLSLTWNIIGKIYLRYVQVRERNPRS